jgi:hypothetical protein
VISNDSDLVEPIRIVIEELKLRVGVVNPHKRNSVELSRYAAFIKPIRTWVLKQSQLPATIKDDVGEITRPARW